MAQQHPNVLAEDPRPMFFPVANAGNLGLFPPPDRHGQSLRTWVRALAGMQKEAFVISGATGLVWRLVSDEGLYLAGHDVGPCPLSFLTTGMVSSHMNEITALAKARGIDIGNIRLTIDNYYTMEGSAAQGTMTGGALAPELTAEIDATADRAILHNLVAQAVDASPITGLLRGSHTSRFALVHNGREIETRSVTALEVPAHPDPGDKFDRAVVSGREVASQPIRKLVEAERVDARPGGVNTSLQDRQSRTLHVQGVCTLRDDGVKEIEQRLFSPIGSTFQYLSDEAPRFGGRGLAPDAATYMSAGIGFCFMTQFGRYARIVRKDLQDYRIVQDTHFSVGGASGGTGLAGRADAVETHVYLQTGEDDEFAQITLDMGEQTCFLHAFCRTDLKPKVRLMAGVAA